MTIAEEAIPQNMHLKFSIFSPTIDIPELEFQMFWHQRSDNALNWLRNTIVTLLKESKLIFILKANSVYLLVHYSN